MLYPRIRLLLALVLLVYAIFVLFTFGMGRAWFAFLAVGLLILTHFIYGTVWASFRQLQKGNFEKAENLINQIKRPDWLAKSAKSYYFLVQGIILMNKKDLDKGKDLLRKALEHGLRTQNDQALVLLNMAHISFLQQNPQEAMVYLKEGKQLKADPFVIKKMEELEETINTAKPT